MQKILILGGTNFIGRNLIEELLKDTHVEITLFNRGITNANLFPEIKKIQGDRNTSAINQIFESHWDYIIDFSCYYPDSLSKIINKVNSSLIRYIFISTCSVYNNDLDKSTLRNENSPTLDCILEECVDTSDATYGKRKAKCERLLQESNLNYSIFRPALVYGQYDSTDRLYYWLYQIYKENELLIPNKGENLFSVTYVKDLVKAILATLNEKLESDIYNITTLPSLSISKLVNTASSLLGKVPHKIYTDSDFLLHHHIAAWKDLPLWLNCDYYTYSNAKLMKDLKIELTDFKHSVKETIEYYNNLEWKLPTFGLSDKLKDKLISLLKTSESENH